YAAYRITKAKAYEMDKKFSNELAKLMYFYNENRSKMVTNGAVNSLLIKVDDLKGLLGDNIKMVLERESKLDSLVKQSDDMLNETKVFTKRSKSLKSKMKRQHFYYYIIAAVFGFLVIYFLAAECYIAVADERCKKPSTSHVGPTPGPWQSLQRI
ncbi:hypothetical protein THAOC_17518, partial [Thalassiosira oceanica]